MTESWYRAGRSIYGRDSGALIAEMPESATPQTGNLIAAARDLLAALEACAAYLQDEAGDGDEVLTLLANTRAAIARARNT